MLLFTRYTSEEVAFAYFLGFVSAIALLCLIGWIIGKVDEYKKLKRLNDRLKNQPEVVDAQFVEVRPKGLPEPSQALVRRRTDLTTKRDSRLTKR